jgi:hypothetical protein
MKENNIYMVIDATRREPIDAVFAQSEFDAVVEFTGFHSLQKIAKEDINLNEKTVMCFELTPEADDSFERFMEDGEYILATYFYDKTSFYRISTSRLH